jgi:hypothetical protein
MEESYKDIMGSWLYLNAGNLGIPENNGNALTDIYLEPYVLFRLYQDTGTLYYLYSSEKFIIPRQWLSLFDSFLITDGARIDEPQLPPTSDNISRTIGLMSGLSKGIDKLKRSTYGGFYGSGGECKEVEYILELASIRTSGFRKWIENEYGVTLKAWEFESFSGRLEF